MSIELSGQNNKKHIWLVSELFYPETISTGYIMTEIAKSLSNDYKVSVICGPEFYEEKEEQNEIKTLPEIEINRIKSKGYNKNSLFFRAIGHFLITCKMLSLMTRKIPNNSEIFMVTNPVLLVLFASSVARRRNWKIKILVHDVFPENLVISGVLKSKTSYIYKMIKRIFDKAFEKMDTIIVLGRDMLKLFEKKVGNQKNITIIENWSDTENISARPIPESSIKKLLFAGNMGRLQGLEILLEALKKTKNEPYMFTFIGNGALENDITAFINKEKTKHIEKYGWIPREQQDEFMSDAAVGVVTLKENMYGLGVPSKFYNLLAAGKPIFYIGDVNSELYFVLKNHDIGWFAEAGNLEDISNTLIKIANTNTNELEMLSKNARFLAETHYNKELILRKFNKLYSNY
ncbi:glycosyltransferase involved in cell wall biosynthesis [Winogradskyella wandonensis]|uniref:Glycosyltransferase involved in cell wall biosynthesis n=1 Tax=Winogradskyella wandonensis TaxID=1442586 RepID=A0A4R1KTC0_9FLAO|nr:glycosyltransferase family 4 protein [Winogradskyella wandonensis]TCK67800.1 glycosyltransferase involved in cell wall biosynthesis [Winogradskyella wandonensis]